MRCDWGCMAVVELDGEELVEFGVFSRTAGSVEVGSLVVFFFCFG